MWGIAWVLLTLCSFSLLVTSHIILHTTKPQHNRTTPPNRTMSSYYPDGLTVDMFGIFASDRGHCCKDHPVCGEIVALGVVVCFCHEIIHITGGADGGPGREEPAIVMYWATDRINACRISFLPWHMNHHAACRGYLPELMQLRPQRNFAWEDLCFTEFICLIFSIGGRWWNCPICINGYLLR